ncbi:hypothetical protein FB451DRAFT_1024550 [Mycena latifolia]|nr:hypothetical protein FB451DRAFT_1024550 [Mycena latifolia]
MSDLDGAALKAGILLDLIVPIIFLFLAWSLPTVPKQPRSDTPYYPSSPSDVFEVRRFLVNFLPPELVNTIIEEAKYWPRIACAEELIEVHASAPDYNSAVRCLVTPPLPTCEELGGPDARMRVKLVNFEILSHDQGWGGEPEHQGTYSGSYTWFEAVILKPGELPKPVGWRRWAVELGCRRLRPRRPLIELDSRWPVQTNVCACRQPLHHTIVWQGGGSVESKEGRQKNGAGDGFGFIERLAPGDRIGVVARAMFPGWSNYVRSVDVVVYYAV